MPIIPETFEIASSRVVPSKLRLDTMIIDTLKSLDWENDVYDLSRIRPRKEHCNIKLDLLQTTSYMWNISQGYKAKHKSTSFNQPT